MKDSLTMLREGVLNMSWEIFDFLACECKTASVSISWLFNYSYVFHEFDVHVGLCGLVGVALKGFV